MTRIRSHTHTRQNKSWRRPPLPPAQSCSMCQIRCARTHTLNISITEKWFQKTSRAVPFPGSSPPPPPVPRPPSPVPLHPTSFAFTFSAAARQRNRAATSPPCSSAMPPHCRRESALQIVEKLRNYECGAETDGFSGPRARSAPVATSARDRRRK